MPAANFFPYVLCAHTSGLLLWCFTDYTMNGKFDQSFLFPGGSGTRNMSASSSPMSTLSSNYRGAGGSFTTETTTTYLSGPGKTDARDWYGEKGVQNTKISFVFILYPPLLLQEALVDWT